MQSILCSAFILETIHFKRFSNFIGVFFVAERKKGVRTKPFTFITPRKLVISVLFPSPRWWAHDGEHVGQSGSFNSGKVQFGATEQLAHQFTAIICVRLTRSFLQNNPVRYTLLFLDYILITVGVFVLVAKISQAWWSAKVIAILFFRKRIQLSAFRHVFPYFNVFTHFAVRPGGQVGSPLSTLSLLDKPVFTQWRALAPGVFETWSTPGLGTR